MLKPFKSSIFHCCIASILASIGWSEDIPKYNRDLFGGWIDIDQDCQNTRHELLQDLSISTLELSDDGCHVRTGRWYDPYTDQYFLDSKHVDIDHLVPLFYAWSRGAYAWDSETRQYFANDPKNLFVVEKKTNREKSANGPTTWLPPNIKFRCEYLLAFQKIVNSYDLKQDSVEKTIISQLQKNYCDF